MSQTKREVRLLRIAKDDLTEIISYIASDRPAAATNLIDRFDQKLSLLADNPHLGSAPKESSLTSLGYRYLVLDSYLVFYVIEAQTIYVHRIVHGARDYTVLL
jgi:toxin ParE1/3/4